MNDLITIIRNNPDLVILNISYILIAVAYIAREMLWLRSIIIVSELMFIAYALMTRNTSIAVWNTVFSSMRRTALTTSWPTLKRLI